MRERVKSRLKPMFDEPDRDYFTDSHGYVITCVEYAELGKALTALPKRKYEPLYRLYFLEQNFKEIGAAMGISKLHAMKLQARAVKLLRDFTDMDEGKIERVLPLLFQRIKQ